MKPFHLIMSIMIGIFIAAMVILVYVFGPLFFPIKINEKEKENFIKKLSEHLYQTDSIPLEDNGWQILNSSGEFTERAIPTNLIWVQKCSTLQVEEIYSIETEELEKIHESVSPLWNNYEEAMKREYCFPHLEWKNGIETYQGGQPNFITLRTFDFASLASSEYLFRCNRYEEGFDTTLTGHFVGIKYLKGYCMMTSIGIALALDFLSLDYFFVKIKEIPLQDKDFYLNILEKLDQVPFPSSTLANSVGVEYFVIEKSIYPYPGWYNQIFREREKNGMLKFYIEDYKVLQEPFYKGKAYFSTRGDKVDKFCKDKRLIIAPIAIPNLYRLYGEFCKSESRLGAAKIACALYAFNADKGAFPDNLEELVPDYIKELPKDTYHYRHN